MYEIREWEDSSSFGAPIIKYALVDSDGTSAGVLYEESFANQVCDLINRSVDEEEFHRIAQEVASEWKMGGLTGTVYEEFAKEILSRYLSRGK